MGFIPFGLPFRFLNQTPHFAPYFYKKKRESPLNNLIILLTSGAFSRACRHLLITLNEGLLASDDTP